MKNIIHHGSLIEKNSPGIGFVDNNGIFIYNDGKKNYELNTKNNPSELRDTDFGQLEQTSILINADIDSMLAQMSNASSNEIDTITRVIPWVDSKFGHLKFYQTRIFEGTAAKNYNATGVNFTVLINRVLLVFEDGADDTTMKICRGRPFKNGICFHTFAIVEATDTALRHWDQIGTPGKTAVVTHPLRYYNELTRAALIEKLGENFKIRENAMYQYAENANTGYESQLAERTWTSSTAKLPEINNSLTAPETVSCWQKNIRNGFIQYNGNNNKSLQPSSYKYVEEPFFPMMYVTDNGKCRFSEVETVYERICNYYSDEKSKKIGAFVASLGFDSSLESTRFYQNDNTPYSGSTSVKNTNIMESLVSGTTVSNWQDLDINPFIMNTVTMATYSYDSLSHWFFQPISYFGKTSSLNGNFNPASYIWSFAENDTNSIHSGDNLCSYNWMRAKHESMKRVYTCLMAYNTSVYRNEWGAYNVNSKCDNNTDVTYHSYEQALSNYYTCVQNHRDFWNGSLDGYGIYGQQEVKHITMSDDIPVIEEFIVGFLTNRINFAYSLRSDISPAYTLVYDNINNEIVDNFTKATTSKYLDVTSSENGFSTENDLDLSYYISVDEAMSDVVEVNVKYLSSTGFYSVKSRRITNNF